MSMPSLLVPIATGIGGLAGIGLAQAIPVSDQTNITLGLVGTAVVFAFTVGVQLTGLKRDIRELKSIIHRLPCVQGKPTCEKSDDIDEV